MNNSLYYLVVASDFTFETGGYTRLYWATDKNFNTTTRNNNKKCTHFSPVAERNDKWSNSWVELAVNAQQPWRFYAFSIADNNL